MKETSKNKGVSKVYPSSFLNSQDNCVLTFQFDIEKHVINCSTIPLKHPHNSIQLIS